MANNLRSSLVNILSTGNKSTGKVKVWDPLVRIGHWTLVAGFFTAYFTEDDFLTAHVWAGYVVGAVICFRIVWGLVGSRHARFRQFVRGPGAVVSYLKNLLAGRSKRYIGHNPAGAAMILALLLSVGGTVYSGLMVYALEDQAGPLSSWVNSARSDGGSEQLKNDHSKRGDFWEETHEILANLSLLLVVMHVVGVLMSSRAHKENLVKSMFTGEKRSED
jgi:cytochrome b